jgi:RNase P/RNase MRP subunit p29
MSTVENFIHERVRGGGRRHIITAETRAQVEMLAGCGLTRLQIASCLGISHETLNKRYRKELDAGPAKGVAAVSRNVFRQATKDNFKAVPAALAWLKQHGGWRDTQKVEVSGGVIVETQEERIRRLRDIAMIDVTPK